MNKSFKRTIAAISMTAMLAAGFAMPVSAATQVEVTGNPVMIRADAGLKNTVVSKAHKGDKYVYVGQKKDSTGRVWYNIKYSGNKTGWGLPRSLPRKQKIQPQSSPSPPPSRCRLPLHL